jgi:tetratricopeptide (TPR) repeat protein
MIYPLICALGVLTIGWRIRPRAKTLMLSIVLGLIGLSVWLYIPIRAGLNPPLVWGRTETLSGFFSHITAQGYRWRLRQFALIARSADSIEFLGVIARQAGLPLAILALAGLVAGVWKKRIILAFAALVALFAIHCAMYSIPDIDSHLFPALIGMGILASFALERIARLAGRSFRRGAMLVSICAFLLLLPNLARIRPRADEWFAIDYAHAIQESARKACGDSCIVVTGGHLSSFPLFYASLVEPGGLPVFDLAVSDPSLLGGIRGTASMEASIAEVAKIFGRERLALLGPLPPRLLGAKPRICGMVYVLDDPPGQCSSPLDFQLRGVGEDLREYSSRLLSGSYYLHIARWHAQTGDTAEVRASVEQALDAAGDDVATHVNAVKIYLDAGMGQAAYLVALKATEVDPEFFEAHDLLANLLAAAGRTDEAIERYKLALKGNPSPGAVHVNLANAYSMKSDHARAIEHYRKAIELDRLLLNAHVGLGLTLEASGKTDEALSSFRNAASVDSTSEIVYHAHASLLLRQGDNAGAMRVLRRGLALRPDAANLLSDLGLAFLRQDRPDSAIAYLERSLTAEPSQLTARGNLAVALERSGLDERATEEYRAYISLAPPGRSRDRAEEALRMLEEESD